MDTNVHACELIAWPALMLLCDRHFRESGDGVFAGPNGSGKTTVMHGLPAFGTAVNADDLKREYGLTDLEAA